MTKWVTLCFGNKNFKPRITGFFRGYTLRDKKAIKNRLIHSNNKGIGDFFKFKTLLKNFTSDTL
jgi:hypothetical protein